MLAQYRGSGLTQIEYCRQAGLALSTLGRCLRRGGVGPQQLMRVHVASDAECGAGFALVLAKGRRIESGWQFGDAELARLIRVVEGA